MSAPTFRISAIEIFERPVALRLPFRFGAATLTSCPQAFVRARIVWADGRTATGAAAELMVPKWFDKAPEKSAQDNIADLAASLAAGKDAYSPGGAPRTAFGHFAEHYASLIESGARGGRNALTASYGAALIDRAVLDALCHAAGVSFYAALRANLPGIDPCLTPDIAGGAIEALLRRIAPRAQIAARHTVGLIDPIDTSDVVARAGDGLPESLEEVIAAYGNRHFKLKVGGDVRADHARLARIAAVLDRRPQSYAVTIDGNEQFADVEAIVALWQAIATDPALARFAANVLAIEQPLPRDVALAQSIAPLATLCPVLIDESDATLDAFPSARALGYTGVSSKGCKGLYKSVLNAVRASEWNSATQGAPYFLTGEDLTTQPGLAVQQDLALVNALGIAHVERNGHHYGNGFASQGAPAAEQRAFLAAHPGLYTLRDGIVRLAVRDGMIDLRSLDGSGYASGAQPDWTTLAPLHAAPAAAVL